MNEQYTCVMQEWNRWKESYVLILVLLHILMKVNQTPKNMITLGLQCCAKRCI